MQHETRPGHVRNLLRVAVETSLDPGLTQSAAIAFKRVVERRWEPRDEGKRGFCWCVVEEKDGLESILLSVWLEM